MQLDVRKNLHDIITSIDSIEEFTSEISSFSEFKKNKLVKRAVERELGIIGEAVNRIKKIAPDIEFQDARKIVDLRNLVIHGYDKVDDAIIWGVIKKHLPTLKDQVVGMI
ncbi:MAG TPA: DUF86 domain-containing protein [bacterium]|jgi:uncharacterized protein with HEPN domain|nr:DUF86 domain-containing protein [bacterium]MDX9805251.1 DUF86 domain-containing protein [bacterium]HNZ53359.1 DUF86 domain-containing protein [bacterium]HOB72109.1 DUF86 domain-containing protein [bacterium]HOG43468.1 DUF86 domain-containing protein [bacterium]